MIGIISFVTHSSHLNYGATLHGWAFQRYLKQRYCIDTIIIKYVPKALIGENFKYPFLNGWKNPFKQSSKWYVYIIKRFLQWVNYAMQPFDNVDKWIKFQAFIDNHLSTTKQTYSYIDLQETNSIEQIPFDMFICESDVIWKLNSIEDIDENFFLSFPVAMNCKKIAYAPSIRKKTMEGDLAEKFRLLTNDFIAISARDKSGSDYLSRFLNKNVPHVLDPTLLLNEEDYDSIIKLPSESNYLLIYTCSSDDTKMVKAAVKYAVDNNLKPIEISNYAINRLMFNHKVSTSIGIEEWLGYMKKASVIVCNSFHGICFSVLFKKDFFVFQRDNSDYRIPDLMKSLGIENRMIPFDSKVLPTEQEQINYEKVYFNLKSLRIQSDAFIMENIAMNVRNANKPQTTLASEELSHISSSCATPTSAAMAGGG